MSPPFSGEFPIHKDTFESQNLDTGNALTSMECISKISPKKSITLSTKWYCLWSEGIDDDMKKVWVVSFKEY